MRSYSGLITSLLPKLEHPGSIKEDLFSILPREDPNLSAFLKSLSSINEKSLSNAANKEFIKIYGYIAEILESYCVPVIPLILSALQSKLNDSNALLHDSVAQSFGMLVHNTMHTFHTLDSACDSLRTIFSALFQNAASVSKVLQVGTAMCVNKVIQHSPLECLIFMLSTITQKLLETLNAPNFKAHGQLLEAVISLVLSVEKAYSPYVTETVSTVVKCVNSEDLVTRKHCMNVLYTLGALLPEDVTPLRTEIVAVSNNCKTDRAKPVREAALETIAVYKKLNSPDTNSAFTGPVNHKFFESANELKNGPVIHSPVNPLPRQSSPRFNEPSFARNNFSLDIEDFRIEPPVTQNNELTSRVSQLEEQNQELSVEFRKLREFTCSELKCINQRLAAVEEMITSVCSRFDAKFKQMSRCSL